MLSVPTLLAVLLCAGLASASCPSGWEYFNYSGYCYWRSNYATDWNGAVNACPDKNGAAKLASIHTLEESDFIMDTYNFADSWIGLNDKTNEGTWKWSDGTSFSYQNWEEDQPDDGGTWGSNQDCVHMPHDHHVNNGKWDDEHCDEEKHFICKF